MVAMCTGIVRMSIRTLTIIERTALVCDVSRIRIIPVFDTLSLWFLFLPVLQDLQSRTLEKVLIFENKVI